MNLQAQVDIDRGEFRLSVRLEIASGEVVALLGPNGAGKSTALRALAGLEPLTSGEIRLGDEVLEDQRRRVPPERRPIGMVFQDYLLFPHLSALENVAFGLRARGAPKDIARAAAADWLGRVGLADQVAVKPPRLSGGQAQRVALARALAVNPSLLLLDEPLAALDAATRPEVRAELRGHLAAYDGSCVLVTHDPLDAMVLADRIIVLERGSVTQQGSPLEIARAPRTDYAARLVGLNFYRGTGDDQTVRLRQRGEFSTAEPVEGEVCVAFSPASVALFGRHPGGSPRNCWRVVVAGLERHGAVVRVDLHGDPPVLADVTAGAVAELGLAPGVELWAAVKATEVHVYPA